MNLDLQSLIRPLDGYNKDVPGYDHRKGWNDAIMHIMDLQRATAAPASAAEPVNVKVKPLEWRVFCGNSGSVEAEAFGDQYVIQNEAEIWCLYRPYQDTPASHHGALHDAKAAAQADFERRIRLTIDT